ncbi:MAG: alpha/beta hydrolase [Alphaproteobacteria bacterium]|nr:alpha/beta hydrolase [Alphaproteobacteria bacterium]
MPSLASRLAALAYRFTGALAPEAVAEALARRFVTPRRRRALHPTLPTGDLGRLPRARGSVIDGATDLAVWEWGEGPAVLLVHGWEDDHHALASFVPALLDRGFRVVAFDLPAHGASSGRLATVPHFAEAIERVRNAKGPFVGAIGHSMGALSLAFAHATRLDLGRLVLIATPHDAASVARHVARRIGFGGEFTLRFLGAISRLAGFPIGGVNFDNLGRRATAEALFLHGTGDRVTPMADALVNAKAWPGASLRLADGAGHRGILTDAAAIAAAIAHIAEAPELDCRVALLGAA